MAGFGKSTPNTNKPKVSQNGPQLLEAAVKAHKKGDIRSAESLYLEAINIGFDHEIAFSNLGLIYKNTNRQSEAILIYERAITKNPNLADAHSNLGNVYKDLGNLEQALASTLKSLELKPDNPDALINLGGIYQDLGNLDQALASTLKSLELKTDNPTAHMNLGNIYKDLGQLDQALAATLKSLELKPDNPTALMNLGGIHKDLGNLDQAHAATLESLDLDPDNPTAHMNLGGIYQDLGNLDLALASTLKSLELKPDNPTAHINLGSIYKDLGNLDKALASTHKSLELKPDNPDAHMNLGRIYKGLGNLDQALASTLKSLELKPEESRTWYILGTIQMAQGKVKKARNNLLKSIKINSKEYGAYFELSTMLKTVEEAEELVKSINSAKIAEVTPKNRSFIEFALSNCFHKSENHDEASKHIRLANKNKLIVYPSNGKKLRQTIANSLSDLDPAEATNVNMSIGKERIFIVGMPRSGSSLLETILSMNPEIKDLGESNSLAKAIAKAKQQKSCNGNHQNIHEHYSQLEPIDNSRHKYSTDKQLYNFIYINWITTQMPAAKIIHCCRNPLDNILSMYRSNLMAGNNYTSNLEDAAKVLVAQEKAMQIQKKRCPEKIFTFDYDQFVNAPKNNLRKLLEWLDLEFENNYLHPEKSTRNVNTASVMQARKPISNKSVGGWKNYKELLEPALRILQENGINIE